MNLYHTTSDEAAKAIEREGFKNSPFLGIAHGVCLASRPLDAGDCVVRHAEVCFEIEVPDQLDLSVWEIEEEGRPEEAYREWLVPDSVVNGWPRRRFTDEQFL